MRILIVQFVPPRHCPDRPQFCHELGVAAAVLRQAGIGAALTAMGGYDPDRLRSAVNEHRPTHVLMDVAPTRITAARHTMADVAEKHFLPVVLVGRYATSQPEQAISIPGVAAIVRGRYERPLLTLLQAWAEGPSAAAEVPGVWLNSEDGFIRNAPDPSQAHPGELPHPDRELFDYARTVAVDHEAAFQATQGCQNWCAHCLNDWYISLYGEQALLRRRDVEDLLGEIAQVTGRYEGIERIAFTGHAFAADTAWLRQFAAEYPRQLQLPYRCHVCLNALDGDTADLLASSGCRQADVEIGSGSSFIREEVLSMRTSRRQIVAGVAALKRAGLKIRGSVFIGAPYESQVSVDETLDLLVQLDLDAVRPRVFYPIPGSRVRETCAENGWISGRGEHCYHTGHSVLDMPSLPARRVDDICRRYDSLLKRRSGRSLGAWWERMVKAGRQPLRLFKHKKRR